MIEDIESTKVSFATPQKGLSHPAIIYVENRSGTIAPVIVTKSDEEYVFHFWGDKTSYKDGRYKIVSDALKIAPGSQTNSLLYIRENASGEDVARVLGQARKNKKPGQPQK
jgi:hypothetical protein